MPSQDPSLSRNVLIAIPVFNEERHLDAVLDAVHRYADHVLVIDDGSTDSSAAILARRGDAYLIRHPENRGYGKSLADAFEFAVGRRFEWLITLDCDEQHEASYIPRFLAAARRGHADIISGTRYPRGHTPLDATPPQDRRRINQIITERLNRDLGLGITDAFCGFKAYRVARLPCLDITVPGYAMPLQLWVQAARAGLRIQELPVRLIYNDPNRHFGGLLDDPDVRLAHYLDVYRAELNSELRIANNELTGEWRMACNELNNSNAS